MIKKHLLTQQKGISTCSLVPQKWLVCLLTLLATFVGSGRMWADEIEIWKVDFGSLVGEYENNLKLGTGSDEFSFKADGAHTKSCYQLLMPNSTEVLTDKIFGYDANDWKVATANTKKGIWNNGSGPRYLVVKNVIKGQRIVIDANATITAGQNAKVSDTDDKTLIVTASGHAAFSLASGNTIYSISLVVDANTDTKDHKIYTGDVIGSGSDTFETAYSNYFELASGKQYHFTFHIDGGDTTWKNWFLDAAKTAAHYGDDGYNQLLRVRADKFFSNASKFHLYKNNMSTELNAGATNIDTFGDDVANAALRNANVDMTVTYADNRLFIFAKTTGTNGTNIYLTGVQDIANVGNPVQLFFGVDHAIMSNLVAEKRDVYKETVLLEKGQGTGKITIDEIDAPYYENEGQKISYMASGTDIKIYATPATGYICEGIGLVSDNPRSFTTRTQDDVFSLKFQGVTYVLNGGEGKTDDPMNQEITLPTPTKTGYSFIGWMNANTDITPTAGYAGEKRTYTEAKTLYALWYKNSYSIDFTASGPLNGTPDRSGVSISEKDVFVAGGTSVGNITINSHEIDSHFGVQTGTSWIYNNGGLYSNNSGGRAYGLNGLLEGEYITVVSSMDPNVNTADAELVSHVGNTYTYKVKKEGGVKFTPARYSTLYSITVSSPCPHTIWSDGNVGSDTDKKDWWNNFSQFYKINKGETLNFQYTIHGGETTRQNWVLMAQTIAKHNGDLGVTTADKERLLVRADGYTWGTNNTGGAITFTRDGTEISPISTWEGNNSSDIIANMKTAVVNITAEFTNEGILTITATSEGNGHTYVLTKSSTAISEDNLYLALTAEQSWIEGITHPIKFIDKNPTIVLTANGSAIYDQKAIGNPQGTNVVYTKVGTTGSVEATLTQDPGSNDYVLSVKGKGTVTVKASCGGQEDTYVLTVDGMIFQDPTPIIAHHEKKYDAQLEMDDYDGVNYEIVTHDTKIVDKDDNVLTPTLDYSAGGGKVTVKLPDNTEGGVVVVRATKGDAVAEFCLTVAYDLKVWDLYSDPLNYGTIVEGDAANSRPGSAHYVIYQDNYTTKGENDADVSANRVQYNNWIDGVNLYAKEDFYKAQSGTKTQGGVAKNYDLLKRNWNFTYKTCTYKDGARTYVNEPLFAFKRTVVGDNARIIKETAGLRFEANPSSFGVSDNDLTNAEGASISVREQDRCVLFRADQSKLIIPRVKCGRYIRIHWYRHSDNSGDRCKIKNGIDLDGRPIDPNDIIRFTGSSYYYNEVEHLEEYRGSLVFKVATPGDCIKDGDNDDCCDVVITPVINGWTEIYRIEVMDKFDSELQICEVDASKIVTESSKQGKQVVGEHYTTTDFWNARSLNNVDAYNRTVFDATNNTAPVYASRLVTKIRTRAKAIAESADVNAVLPGGEAPKLYISGYPGHCFTWNGWMNTTLQAHFSGTASCKTETNTQGSFSQDNTVVIDPIWVGQNVRYTMHPLDEVEGEGTIKLTLRTHSGTIGTNEPHYTFDKQEAYVAVGQYSVQEYPYTWDFTNYNFGLNNKYGSKTFGAMSDNNVNAAETKEYGHWRKNSNNVWSMHAYQTKISSSMGGHTVKDENKQLNKPYFAQGAQLALGTDASKHTILETEGLRVTIPALTTGTNLVKLVASDEATDTDRGYMTICSGGTITIPEVTEGMYVFVKSSTAPTSTTHTTGSDVTFASNNDGNVTYYKATGGDVTLTFNSGATLYKIGVTDQVKDINAYGYSTESRKYDIDHNETRYFSANVSAYYVGNYSKSSSTVGETKVQDDAYVPKFTGVLLHDEVAGTAREAYKIPLFVPACNITEDNTAEGNCMKPTTTEGNITSDMSVPAVDGDYTNYTLTNLYGKVQNSTVPNYGSDHTIGFYKFYGGSMTQNKSYLHLPTSGLSETSKVKGFIFLPGSEMDDEESTPIKTVEVDIDDDAEYFTVNGLKLNGAPTKSGVYIKNGQKVYVK